MGFSFLFQPVGSGEEQSYFDWLMTGMGLTALVSFLSFLLALSFGIFLGVGRTRKGSLKWISNGFFEVFSNIPLKIQMFFAYFVLPNLFFPSIVKDFSPLILSLFAGIFSLGFFMSCRVSSHIKASIEALSESQAVAAQSLGFTVFQAYRLVLLPQALKNSIPALTNEFMSTIKNSSIAGTIGVAELFYQCKRLSEFTAAIYEPAILVVLGFFLMNCIVLIIMKKMQSWL